MGVTAAVIGGIGLASNLMSQEEQRKANRAERKAQEEANRVERRRAEIANQRERRKMAAQVAQAQASNIAAATAYGGGGAGSSSLLGANLGTRSDLGSAIGFQNTQLAAAGAVSNALQRGANEAARYTNRANMYGAVSQMSMQALPYSIPK